MRTDGMLVGGLLLFLWVVAMLLSPGLILRPV
jgi:hypothetical protein